MILIVYFFVLLYKLVHFYIYSIVLLISYKISFCDFYITIKNMCLYIIEIIVICFYLTIWHVVHDNIFKIKILICLLNRSKYVVFYFSYVNYQLTFGQNGLWPERKKSEIGLHIL